MLPGGVTSGQACGVGCGSTSSGGPVGGALDMSRSMARGGGVVTMGVNTRRNLRLRRVTRPDPSVFTRYWSC